MTEQETGIVPVLVCAPTVPEEDRRVILDHRSSVPEAVGKGTAAAMGGAAAVAAAAMTWLGVQQAVLGPRQDWAGPWVIDLMAAVVDAVIAGVGLALVGGVAVVAGVETARDMQARLRRRTWWQQRCEWWQLIAEHQENVIWVAEVADSRRWLVDRLAQVAMWAEHADLPPEQLAEVRKGVWMAARCAHLAGQSAPAIQTDQQRIAAADPDDLEVIEQRWRLTAARRRLDLLDHRVHQVLSIVEQLRRAVERGREREAATVAAAMLPLTSPVPNLMARADALLTESAGVDDA